MKKSTEASQAINSISRLSTGTKFNGDVVSDGDIRIDGSFKGNILCRGRIVVGENAVVEARIICENIDLWGKLVGNVVVKDTLSLKESSELLADIKVKKLSVELGAEFNGNCTMLKEGEYESCSKDFIISEEKEEKNLETNKEDKK